MKSVSKKEIGTHSYYKIKNMLLGSKPKIDKVQIYITYGEMKESCTIPKIK